MCNFMKDKRRRLYEITIYESTIESIAYAKSLDNCTYYYILHDKDFYDDDSINDDGSYNHKKGDVKKAHHHLLLYFTDGITLSSLAKKLHLEGQENYIKFWSSNDPKGRKDYRIQYLVHYKSKTEFKHEYPIENINTNDENIMKYFPIDDKKMSKDIILLFDYFDSRQGMVLSYRNFLGYVYEQGLWGTYQRNASIFNRLFDEHNNDSKEDLLQIFK